ncbi:MAG: hypothetical protein AAB370_12080 [Verrucomicrobiota bacterium]
MNPLKSRKQILIAESELNRAHLVQDWQTMAGEVHALAEEARTIRSMAAAAASLVAGLAALRRKKSAPAEKPAWWQTILKGGQMISSLWSEFRPRPR